MTADGGICERFYRLLAVTFSLFRHPPRGGLADATFPRWGKEMAAADSPFFSVNVAFLRGAPGLSVRPKRPCPFPPRVGAGVLDGPEGVAHKGDRRGRT